MYGLAVGISRVGSTLPDPVYALLSGLNAATVGIIALAGVRLSERAITDKLTRFLVYLGGALGNLYTALWYYPVLMLGSGLVTMLWDTGYLQALAGYLKSLLRKPTAKENLIHDIEKASWESNSRSSQGTDKPLPPPPPIYSVYNTSIKKDQFSHPRPAPIPTNRRTTLSSSDLPLDNNKSSSSSNNLTSMSWKLGSAIILLFFATFITSLALHATTKNPPQSFSLFSSLYLAGTIIFGGGPVVIPLLREYTVTPGWVHPRDFLLGLAIIQAFPGPNFNFAVYLGALAVAGTAVPSYLGALIAFVAMYAPGLFIVVGFMGLWRILRDKGWFLALLRGINAAAVGLVFTAVYKLWQMGYLTSQEQNGSPLGTDPWLVAITGTAFVGGAWFGLNPPVAILLGGAMGVARYGVVVR